MNDSNDPDDLSDFGTELDADTTRRTKARTPDDDDWLSVFITEPHLDTLPAARDRARVSVDDDLSQFPPDEHVHQASDDEEGFLDVFPQQSPVPPPVPAAMLQARSQPWAGPWAAAVVAIVISVLLGTRSLHPTWWNGGAVPPARQVATPGVEAGIPSGTLRQFDTVAIEIPRIASANVRSPRNESESGPTVVPKPTPTANAHALTRPAVMPKSTPTADAQPPTRLAVVPKPTLPAAPLSAQKTDRVPSVDVPLAPVAVAGRTATELLPDTPRAPFRPDVSVAPVTTASASEAATQEYAVRTALNSYQQAYEALDVAATVAVWPSVDQRALARAFDTIKSQGVNFKSCAITVTDSVATARCRGTLEVVRKVGNSMPLMAEQEWMFKMRRLGANWKIDNVAATRADGLAAQRNPRG